LSLLRRRRARGPRLQEEEDGPPRPMAVAVRRTTGTGCVEEEASFPVPSGADDRASGGDPRQLDVGVELTRPWYRTARPSARHEAVSAPGPIRTADLSLRRRALYPLSYGRLCLQTDASLCSSRLLGGGFCAPFAQSLTQTSVRSALNEGAELGDLVLVTTHRLSIDREYEPRIGVTHLRAGAYGSDRKVSRRL
jgi:hypothetical protein